MVVRELHFRQNVTTVGLTCPRSRPWLKCDDVRTKFSSAGTIHSIAFCCEMGIFLKLFRSFGGTFLQVGAAYRTCSVDFLYSCGVLFLLRAFL